MGAKEPTPPPSPETGGKGVCEDCGKPVIFDGHKWDHVGEPKPRHIARPWRPQRPTPQAPPRPAPSYMQVLEQQHAASIVQAASRRALAEKIVDDLMTSPIGTAERLVLALPGGRDGGGWGREPLVRRIEQWLSAER